MGVLPHPDTDLIMTEETSGLVGSVVPNFGSDTGPASFGFSRVGESGLTGGVAE